MLDGHDRSKRLLLVDPPVEDALAVKARGDAGVVVPLSWSLVENLGLVEVPLSRVQDVAVGEKDAVGRAAPPEENVVLGDCHGRMVGPGRRDGS